MVKTCPRTDLVSKLKNVADTLGRRKGRILSLRPETVAETKNEKYISKWVPDYTNFKLCQHPLYPYPRPPNDVQLLASDIIGMCLCLKRNGLQDDCPKLGCRGRETKRCVTRPIPTCVPSGLGRLPPKPIRISRPKVLPHPELVRSNRIKLANEKKQRSLRYINMGAKNYTNEYRSCPLFKPCHRHDGTYVRKTLRCERETQTQIEEYCHCKETSQSEDCVVEGDVKSEAKSQEPNASQVENVFREKIDECMETMNTKIPLKDAQLMSSPSKNQTNPSTTSLEKPKRKNRHEFCLDNDVKQSIKVVKIQ